MTKMRLVAVTCLLLGVSACGNDANTHTASQLLPALLTVNDMPAKLDSTPVDWYENMRKVIDNPVPPWQDTLDPYLCSEAGTPAALTKEQAQLELTGGSIMEILLSSADAEDLFTELVDAYKTCSGTTTPSYSELTDVAEVGDESATFKSAQGVATVARAENDIIIILKWWVGNFYERVAADYPAIVAKAVEKVESL